MYKLLTTLFFAVLCFVAQAQVQQFNKVKIKESLQVSKSTATDTLLFLIQNNDGGNGLLLDIDTDSVSFDFSATDAGFFLNYQNGDTSTFDVRAEGVLLQWGANDGNVGIGTEAPTAKLQVNGTFRLTDSTQADGYILQSDSSGNATWVDIFGFGEMGFGDSTSTQALTQNVWHIVTNGNEDLWATAAIDLENVAYSNDSLIIGKDGTYQISAQLSVDGAANSVIRLGVYVNGALVCSCTGYQELANNTIIQLNYINIDELQADDVVQVVITNTANNDDVDAVAGKITIVRIK